MKHAFFAALLVACSSSSSSGTTDGGGPPPILASDYDTSCAAPTDCATIDEGNVCGCGGCGNAAINKRDLSKYQTDYAARVKLCPGGGPQLCPAACILSELTCISGKCGVCHSPGCADAGASDASHD